MLISLCIPVMNRVGDLRRALPRMVDAANESPPIQVAVLDYSSTDGLQDYMDEAMATLKLADGNCWKFTVEPGQKFYRVGHATNLAMLAGSGEFVMRLSADAIPVREAFVGIRMRIEKYQPDWMCEGLTLGRWLIIKKSEFIAAGGYDERFTVYGPEDKEICKRLRRRGLRFARFPGGLIDDIPTPYALKLANYDQSPYTDPELQLRQQMHRDMARIYEENNENGVLVANAGRAWGQ